MNETAEQTGNNGRVSIWPTTWKYSMIIAAVLFIYTVILYVTGLAMATGVNLLAFVIYIVLLVIALKEYRRKNNGYMTFGAAALAGILISVISRIIGSTLNAIYLAFIDDSVLDDMLDQTIQALEATPGINSDQLEMLTGIYEKVFTPVGIFCIEVIVGTIAGIIVSLITAAILKNPPPLPE